MAQLNDLIVTGNTRLIGSSYNNNSIISNVSSGTYLAGNKGTAIINSSTPAGYTMLARQKSTNGVFTLGVYNATYNLFYTADSTISAGTNGVTKQVKLLDESGNAAFPGTVDVISNVKVGGVRLPRLYSGTGDPAVSTGADGDIYIKYS